MSGVSDSIIDKNPLWVEPNIRKMELYVKNTDDNVGFRHNRVGIRLAVILAPNRGGANNPPCNFSTY